METKSLWLSETKSNKNYLSGTSTTAVSNIDVIVVGAGITGLVTAYRLQQSGKKVMVLEKDKVAGGETAYTTAFITYVIDTDLPVLTKRFGKENAKMIWNSATEAIDYIEEIINTEKIDCDFMRVPGVNFTTTQEDVEFLQELQTAAIEIGYNPEFRSLQLDVDAALAELHFPDQAKFSPLKFLYSLAKICSERGVIIREDATVASYSKETERQVVELEGGEKLYSDFVVVATHNPNNGAQEVISRLTPCQTYVLTAEIPSGIFPEQLYWDTAEPYHYFRIDKSETEGKQLITLGGEDHRTGTSPEKDPQEELEKFLISLLPEGTTYQMKYRWSGQVLESIDGIPFIGRNLRNKGQFIATGFAGDGMIFGPLSAIINTDLILGRENKWEHLYTAKRLFNIPQLMKRGLEITGGLIGNRLNNLKPNSDADIEKMPPGTGKVLNLQGKQVAVYKDDNGKVVRRSAVCTHQGCIVHWNQQAQSWDCGCHGSRFATSGEVMAGPAKKPLEKHN